MRNTNALLVLDYIRLNGETTRRSIQQATGLSWAAVSNISTDLISKSVLRELPFPGKMAGRNPGYLDFVPMQNLTIGMDLNAEGITVQLLDLRCNVVDQIQEAIRSFERDHVIAQMLDAIGKLIRRNDLHPKAILGIGIATQGSVDKAGAMSLFNSSFHDWRDVPLKDICEKRFGIPVHVMHDPVCIALAEQWQRKLNENNDFAMVRLSYGIGMSYVANGMPITGCDGIAGEMGHMVLDPNGPRCSCGNRGCMESYCSIRGLSYRIVEAHHNGTISLPEELREINDRNVLSMRSVVSWAAGQARNGNVILRAMFDDAGYFLGVGIANVVSLFNPEYVILTGEMLEFEDMVLEKAKETASETVWSLSKYEVVLSHGGKHQAAMGAALYFINQAFNSLESRLLEQTVIA
jgi:predicted NBD/HSP70 family sugar kinase